MGPILRLFRLGSIARGRVRVAAVEDRFSRLSPVTLWVSWAVYSSERAWPSPVLPLHPGQDWRLQIHRGRILVWHQRQSRTSGYRHRCFLYEGATLMVSANPRVFLYCDVVCEHSSRRIPRSIGRGWCVWPSGELHPHMTGWPPSPKRKSAPFRPPPRDGYEPFALKAKVRCKNGQTAASERASGHWEPARRALRGHS